MKVKSESEVAQSCPTPSDPMDCNLPSSSVHGVFKARVLEWAPSPSPSLNTRHRKYLTATQTDEDPTGLGKRENWTGEQYSE